MAAARILIVFMAIILLLPSDSYAKGNDEITITYATNAKIISYPLHIKAPQNTSFEFSIIVKNTGNSELRRLNLETENDWITIKQENFSLFPKETQTITITLLIPQHTKPGDYPVNLSLNAPPSNKDTVSFQVTVIGEGESASMSRIDEEFVRVAIEDFKKRVMLFSGNGYRIKEPERFAEKAEDSFRDGRILEAISYLDFGEDSLAQSAKKAATINTFSTLYILIMLIFGPLVLAYYVYKKYVKKACE